jgi:amino acid efflux transporter
MSISTTQPPLSSVRGTALYVGALLGPGLLLLPGLAAAIAGPASIVAWLGLLVLSGGFAVLFSRLGTRLPAGGVAAYAATGLGPRAGRAVGWCFLAGVITGAPVVCLIGGGYVAALLGGGHHTAVLAAAGLLAIVLLLTLSGARATTAVQLVLVGFMAVLVVVAAAGSAPAAHTANWSPFAPHGWTAVGEAASVLMLSFVGWEAIAPLTARLASPHRQLPRIIAAAFVITAVVYLGLAVTTIGVLGRHAASAVPVADLLRVAIGTAGPVLAVVGAVALTLAATNAYMSGAAALAADLVRGPAGRTRTVVPLATTAVGVVALSADAAGWIDTAHLVAIPTALFLAVYLGCTAAATRVLTGPVRLLGAAACAAVAVVFCFTGWAAGGAVLVALVAGGVRRRGGTGATRGARRRPVPAAAGVPTASTARCEP